MNKQNCNKNTTDYVFMDNVTGLQEVPIKEQHSISFLMNRLQILGINFLEIDRSIKSLFLNSSVIDLATKCSIVFQKYYNKTSSESRYKEMFSYFGSKFQRESTEAEQKQAIEQRKEALLVSLIAIFK